MITDEILYRNFLDGDENALQKLIDRHGKKLIFYINGFICNIHDAEDLMLEAISYIVIKKPEIRERGLKPYLYQSARHLALRYLVNTRRYNYLNIDDLLIEPENGAVTEEIIYTNNSNKIIRLCLAQLKQEYKDALQLIYFENMSYAETANIMGKSEKQIDNLLQRGKKALRINLEKEGITNINL